MLLAATAPVKIAKVSAATLRRRQLDGLLLIADRLEPRLRARFLAALASLRGDVALRALAAAFAAGDYAAISRLVGVDELAVALGPLTDAAHAGFASAGVETARAVAAGEAGYALGVRFDVAHERAAAAARRNSYGLIRDITQTARLAVKQAVDYAVERGLNPLTAARHVRGALGLTQRQERALESYRDALVRRDTASALARSLGVRLEQQTARIVAEPAVASHRIEDAVEAYRVRLLRQRAETIARTEAMRAVSAGNRVAWEQVVERARDDGSASRVRRYWVATDDARTRDDHRLIPELNAAGVGLNEPFTLPDGGSILFPHDPDAPPEQTINCRCTVVTRLEVDAPLFAVVPGRSILPTGSRSGVTR